MKATCSAMDNNPAIVKEKSGRRVKLEDYDLARLKWLDPCDRERFVKRPILRRTRGTSEGLLQSIMQLTEEIFSDLSVFEQFAETTSRGATASPVNRVALRTGRGRLLKAEQELWVLYSMLQRRRQAFIRRQLKALRINKMTKELKVHLGCAHYLLANWLNVDAGGADLTINVNWGLPLPNGCAAFVYCAHLLEHLRYSDQAPLFVREVRRILKANGTVRFVVPDVGALLAAYARDDRAFFAQRRTFYPLSRGFVANGCATLDYLLLFCGAGPQLLNYNHKFGYDATSLCRLLRRAGFRKVHASKFQESAHAELRIDDFGYNARARRENEHYSLFVEATR
jgi:SAM-dependent methyltransferase